MLSQKLLSAAAAIALSLPLTGCLDDVAVPADQVAKEATPSASKALQQIFADSDEASLKLSPIGALFRGDQRYAGEFGDYITDAYIDQSRRDAEADLRRLREIDRKTLSPQDQLAYDVFEYQTKQALEGLSPALVVLSAPRPLNHLNGLHVQYPDISSGKSAARFQTVEDYDNGLKRMTGFVTYIDRAIGRMREGLKSGVVESKLTMRLMLPQLDDLISQGVEKSPFYQPIRDIPATFAEADKKRLAAAYRAMLSDQIIPSYERLRTFVKKEYLPAARAGVGLGAMKGGDKLYAYLVEANTTTKLTADEIHNLGLSEVARIKGEMDEVRRTVGFKGSLHAFFSHLRTAKQFEPKSEEDLQARYADIAKRIEAAIPGAFSLTPKTKIELRPVPDYLEQSQAGGYYNPGTPDGSRAGVFYFNKYDLPSRKTWGMETLYLHEAEPGHHFQISLAQENEGLPKFMRFGGNTAYVEGWALYAEWLGRGLGMYKDPYQKFGHLNDEQLRAMRLVVDTGLHANGWSREKAINYMLDNSALSRTETVQEVDRYIANPGQALGYKVGQLTIKRLRAEAEKAMGQRFDLKAFHAQILDTGALPMDILEAKIKAWMATSK
ncbi:MAG: DUF885 domain-containing protein [Alphaproteobacteria bacterium]|nr:DUF885 domain-containing protein [Alphaproteobacteria bacterium]